MKKTLIVYASIHHQNTYKVVEFLASHLDADLLDATKANNYDCGGYENVIFASGIYFSKLHRAVVDYMNKADLSDKKVVIVYTCGIRACDYAAQYRKTLKDKGTFYLGKSISRGLDTNGFFAKLGGISKGHPNDKDLNRVLREISKLLGA
jgi:Flavodoxins